MSVWDQYPENYRAKECQALLAAAQAGDCAAVIGLSGAGKSNLMGFLAHRMDTGRPTLILVDGNRALPRSAAGLLHAMRLVLGEGKVMEGVRPVGAAEEELPALEDGAARRLAGQPDGLCFLIDRYDALSAAEQDTAASLLRALRDRFKYQLTYIIATRRPVLQTNELAELFYANTLWLGPLSAENARWSAGQYALRRGAQWSEGEIDQLVKISWGYPALLRACCEAFAAGAELDLETLRRHPAVERRVQEFWQDEPSVEDIARSNLKGQPLLASSQPAPDADHPSLTASEHRLLAYLQAHSGEVCTKDDLIRAIWPEERLIEGLRDDSLAQLVRRLRQKVEPNPTHPTHIQTVAGRGYRYVP